MNSAISRRDLLGCGLALGAGVFLLPAVEAFADSPAEPHDEMAAGIVFDIDNAKTGIPDVLVSNGRDIVRTDGRGGYKIPVRDGDVLFVIKPPQWMTPLTEYNLPKFYYFH